MKKITCDKCGCELNEQTNSPILIGGKPWEYFDLCGDCLEALIDWLADGAPVEATEPPAVRRLAAGELAAMAGCSKSHVFKWFDRNGVRLDAGELETFTDSLGRRVKRRVYELTERQLADFMREHGKAEPAAEDDDPLYGGPKNDKVGYTVEELMEASGRDFYAVLAGLERLGVTPCSWKRDGKTHCKFYLSPDELGRLSAAN